MKVFNRILFLGLLTASVVFTHPTSEGDNNELAVEDKVEVEPIAEVAIGEALSVTKPTRTIFSNGDVHQREKLRHDLFDKYDRKTIPDNVTVKFGIALINFDIDEQKSTFEAGVWLRYVWNDSRLVWDKAEYGGIGVLRIDPDDLWMPDITHYNSADHPNMMNCWKSHALIYPNGEILWVPPCHISSMCELTLEEYPYANQNCTIKVGSWTYDGHQVDLQFYNDTAEIDMSDFWKSPRWEIVSNSAKRTNKFYDCCTEPYPDLTFQILFKRRANLISHKDANVKE